MQHILITNLWMVDLVEVDRMVVHREEGVEGILEEASLAISSLRLYQVAAGRTFPGTMVTPLTGRQGDVIKEMVASLFASTVRDWLELNSL